jgi:hypothetical protein
VALFCRLRGLRMAPIELRQLGSDGLNYIRQHLTGINTFCGGLLRAINIHAGNVFTFAPPGTSMDRLVQFETGGLLSQNLLVTGTVMPIVSLRHQQVSLLRQAMTSYAGAVCVVDDFNPRWTERAAYPLERTAFGVGDEVYHLLKHEDSDEDFADTISAGFTFWHAVSAVCRVPIVLKSEREVETDGLIRCAESATLIICTAYDGEGFVAWRRIAA